MASKEDAQDAKGTVCSCCKESLKKILREFTQDWTNNFKMCYCPWMSKTYDVDADPSSDEVSSEQKEQEMVSITKDRGKVDKSTSKDKEQVDTSTSEDTGEADYSTFRVNKDQVNTPTFKVNTEQVDITSRVKEQADTPTFTVNMEQVDTTSRVKEQADTPTFTVNMEQVDTTSRVKEQVNTTVTEDQVTLERLVALDIEPTIFKSLGFYLQIGNDTLNEISRNTSPTSKCLREMYREWLKRDKDISWESLAQALEAMGLNDKAREVRRKHVRGST